MFMEICVFINHSGCLRIVSYKIWHKKYISEYGNVVVTLHSVFNITTDYYISGVVSKDY